MKLKPAELTSRSEAAERLRKGDVFYYNDYRMYYTADAIYTGRSPYRTINHDGTIDDGINALWQHYADWAIEGNWEEDIDGANPILCRVWEFNEDLPSSDVRYILARGYNTGSGMRYVDCDGGLWVRATPIHASECWDYNE